MASSNLSTDVRANVTYFSSNEKFKHVKPYTTSFPVDDIPGAVVSNQEWSEVEVAIQDLRVNDLSPQLDIHGFTVLKSKTTLVFDDFESRDTVEATYFPELADLMQQHFPQYKTFAFFDYEIRKRSPLYPYAKGASTDNAQPYAYAHVDFTPYGAELKLRHALGENADELLENDVDILSMWRVLKGPNSDWPLAFCDFRSIDNDNDPIFNDVVYRGGLGESSYLRANPLHKWYYISRQTADEVFLWRNTDIPDGKRPRAFHAAFPNKLASDDELRESVEVRFAAFR